ncbi:MAG: histidine kinase [Comamonadaceae bacterium]|nr:MAG: histidine kinase [Comamonadaceae bacterium]
MSRFAFPKRTLSLLLALFAALTLLAINEVGYRRSTYALAEIRNGQQVRQILGALLQNILDAETGQRGYLLTGELRYREPYDRAIGQVNGHLVTLRDFYVGRSEEAQKLGVLADHVARRLAELDLGARMRQAGNDDAWKFVINTDVGREEMDSIRAEIGGLIATSNRSIDAGQQQIADALKLSRVGIAVVALAALLAFYLYLRQTSALQSIGERQQGLLQRERDALEGVVQERTASLAELATHLQNVRETERGYLARELHDELGSLLTAAKLDVARLKSRLADVPDAMARLQHLTDLLNSGITLKRRIIEDLRPSSLSNLGLIPSLEILAREFGDRASLQVDMALEPVTLNETQQLTVYRMVQESLNNVGKYAQAKEVTVVLKNYGNHVVIEVADDGVGFDPHSIPSSSHGLAGIRHRVEAAGGKLTIDSQPGNGARLSVVLPQGAFAPRLPGAHV